MEAFVELGVEGVNHFTETKHFDKVHDATLGRKDKKRAEERERKEQRRNPADENADDRQSRVSRATTYAPAAATAPSIAESRRRQRNALPSPERDQDYYTTGRRSRDDDETESEISDRITRTRYEREADDPVRSPQSVLSRGSQLKGGKGTGPRRDSAMTSQYGGDAYSQAPYRSRSSQPAAKSRYDDDDSDYDERSGRRYRKSSGRGYDDRDDRDYDIVREETERYRGPVSAGPLVAVNRPWDAERKDSYRSGYDGAGAGTLAPYDRRQARDDDRGTHLTRREKSGGRGRNDRDSYRSESRSRSRSRDRGDGGFKEKLEGAFDTSGRGLGVGLAGAVIGGLAGRQFGKKHQERDIILGAIVGGLASNAAENKYREWKGDKRERLDEREDRWEQRFEGGGGRSRSNVR